MNVYTPSDALIKAVLAGIAMPLPTLAGFAFKAVPFKEQAMSKALAFAIPLALSAIASTKSAGARVALTKHGKLTEETKQSVINKIASWFTPDELTNFTEALRTDLVRMGEEAFASDGWRVEITESEIVLVVTDTSLIRESADTAVDVFMRSSEKIRTVLIKVLPSLKKK